MEVYHICPVCNSTLESSEHVLLFCPYAQSCWKLSALNINISAETSIQQNLSILFATTTSKDLELFCCVAWQIWSHRNKVVWNHKSQTPSNLIDSASSMLFQWQKARVKQVTSKSMNDREGVLVWQKPTPG